MSPSTKVFGYTRVSSKGQVDGDGPIRQEQAIRDYAAAHDMVVERVFVEEGVSGDTDKRPALAEMLVSLEQNGHGVATVVIERVDRIARDLMVQEVIIGDLRKLGVRLVSAVEGDDLLSGDPTRTLIRQLLGAVAQYDKAMLVLKLRVARERRKAATGKCEGRKGYREARPELMAKVDGMREKGMPYRVVAGVLNAAEEWTMAGGRWTAHSLRMVVARNSKGVGGGGSKSGGVEDGDER